MSTDLPVGYNGMEPAEIPIEEKRVGFGKRLGALILDYVIAFLVGVVLTFAIKDMVAPYVLDVENSKVEFFREFVPQMPDVDIDTDSLSFFLTCSNYIASFLGVLLSLLDIVMSASLGKMILGITIANKDGKKANSGSLIIRWLVKHPMSILTVITGMHFSILFITGSMFLGLFFLIDCLLVFGSKRQSIHDMIAKTAVFEKEDITD